MNIKSELNALNVFDRYADQLSIDHEVLVQGNNEVTSAKVVNVSNITMQGRFVILFS